MNNIASTNAPSFFTLNTLKEAGKITLLGAGAIAATAIVVACVVACVAIPVLLTLGGLALIATALSVTPASFSLTQIGIFSVTVGLTIFAIPTFLATLH